MDILWFLANVSGLSYGGLLTYWKCQSPARKPYGAAVHAYSSEARM